MPQTRASSFVTEHPTPRPAGREVSCLSTSHFTGDCTMARLRKPIGLVLYEGPSRITGEPIVVILTGLVRPSKNQKTGPMLQCWILRRDMNPIKAGERGKATLTAICGVCALM